MNDLTSTWEPLPRPLERLARTVAAALGRPLRLEVDEPGPAAVPAPAAESYSIGLAGGGVALRAGGRRGLWYGLHELRAQVAGGGVEPVVRGPELAVRSICFFPHNRQIEAPWIHRRDYWEAWFALLAEARLNMFSFTFAHQTAYLAPPYPFLVKVPGWERVRTPGWTAVDRRRYLKTLQTIGELAAEYGIALVLGIWTQQALKDPRNGVRGLTYEEYFDYCPAGLAALLREVPQIGGLQLRMNSESGIAEDDQERFFGPLFDAVRDCGRPLWLDLRAKGLRPETIAAARARGLDLTVSTKFWCEHLGLPRFQARTNPLDAAQYRRYGYWDLLRRDRPYRMLWRLWTVGTQRVLPWGSLDYTRTFAASCREGDGLGFEVCAPESNKGFGNYPGGAWETIDPPELRVGRWAFERHWPFFLAFGLGGYGGGEGVWQAAFERRLGGQAGALRTALETASGILPLVTAAHAASASTFGSWIELYTGGLSEAYARIGSGDVARIQSIHEYVEMLFGAAPDGRLRPPAVADRLEAMAAATLAGLPATCPDSHEATQLGEQVKVVAGLGYYHAWRIRSAIDWLCFRRAGDGEALGRAIAAYRRALTWWRQIVAGTTPRFYPHMTFNLPGRQVGHWQDELPWLEQELARLEEVARQWSAVEADAAALPAAPEEPWYQIEHVWEDRDGTIHHRQGKRIPAEPLSYPQYGLPPMYVVQEPAAVVREVWLATGGGSPAPAPAPAGPPPAIRFMPPAGCRAGRELRVRAEVTASQPLQWVRLHARPQHQAEDWTVLPMTPDGNGGWTATVPGTLIGDEYDLELAVEAIDTGGHGSFCPGWDEGRAAFTVPVSR